MARKLVFDKLLQIRISTDTKNILEERAKKQGITASDYIRNLIIKDCEK